MDTPSKRVHTYLAGAGLGVDVIHVGAEKCPLPYALVRQSGGDWDVAQIEIECWGADIDAASTVADKVRRKLKFANVGGSTPSLEGWAELYVVPQDGKARAGVGLRYNLPVYQER